MERNVDGQRKRLQSDSCDYRSSYSLFHQQDSGDLPNTRTLHDKRMCSHSQHFPRASPSADERATPLSDQRNSFVSKGGHGRGRREWGRVKQMHHHKNSIPERGNSKLFKSHHQPMKGHYSKASYNFCDRKFVNRSFGASGKYSRRSQSWLENIRPFSKSEIAELALLQPEKLVTKLSAKIKVFQDTLSKSTLTNDDVMDTILEILSKIATFLGKITHTTSNDLGNKACLILGEVLSDRCAVFQLNLKLYISNLKKLSITHSESSTLEQKIKTICTLFCKLLQILPDSAWSVLPINELKCKVDEVVQLSHSSETGSDSDTLICMMHDIFSFHELAREQHTARCTVVENASHDQDWNNYDYRNISILPRWEEICTSCNISSRCLRKNIVQGCYSDWLHYYDIQFRLLREDFIAPLRKGINDYFQGLRGRKLKNVRIYKNVCLTKPLLTDSGICYRISIRVSHVRYNWEHSKKLLFGSLLCLTPDDFKDHIYFGTVISRDTEKIATGELHVDVLFQDTVELLKLREKSFTMVESCAYFEGSRHILRSLQTAEVNTMPFTKYLIAGECNSVNEPQYLAENPTTLYDISHLIAKDKESSFDGKNCLSRVAKKTNDLGASLVDVSNVTSWPSLDLVELDESQLRALQNALTQEIALIQGPPGTGKTYIGLKIVETLLNNQSVWNWDGMSPILVMCYTNHALDQFLEGILECPFYKSARDKVGLVRIGSRSKSEQLNGFNIRHLRKKVTMPQKVCKKKFRAMDEVTQCRISVQELFEELIQSDKYIMHFQKLVKFMHPDHHYYFTFGTETIDQREGMFLIWLGVLEVVLPNFHCNQLDPNIATSAQENKPSLTEHISGDISQMHVPTHRVDHEGIAVPYDKEFGYDLIDVRTDDQIELHQRTLDDDDYAVTEFEKTKELYFHQQSQFSPYIPEDSPEYAPKIVGDLQSAARVENQIATVKPMTEMNAVKIKNIGKLSSNDRLRLYRYWHSLYQDQLLHRCKEEIEKYNKLCTKVEELRKEMDRYVLEEASVIGMTTTGAAKYQHILHMVKPRIVIIEEAAEVLESHVVSALNAGTQHLILIGDHKQLKPKPNVYELAKKYRLDVSLFERLILNNHPHVTLTVQHRMRPEIAQLVKPHIYDILFNHRSVEEYPNIRGVSTNLYFISHDKHEHNDTDIMSHSNVHEAKYLVALCRYFLQQNYAPGQITILVTYSGQLFALRKLMPKCHFEGVRLSTVDNFQGEENDIILLSLVRSNSASEVGFLKEENRVCVALSRARMGFYCIGNFKMLCAQVPIWEAIMSDMESKCKLGDGLLLQCNNHPNITFVAKNGQDFTDNSPKGGCRNTCLFRLQCGHVCSSICHNTDPEHTSYRCLKPCAKKCPDDHPCDKLCWKNCKCTVNVIQRLACGHEAKMHCHIDPTTVKCTKPCQKVCPKRGHSCPLKCFQGCYTNCSKDVVVEMPSCRHKVVVQCFIDHDLIPCTSNCSRKCPEGHSCKKMCYQPCGDCKVQVLKTVPECNHKVKLPCHVECDRKNCTAPCKKLLSCKHLCPNKCNEPCGKSRCEVQVLKTISECGHKLMFSCHTDPLPKNCTESCKKILPCKHKCELKCGELCSIVKCQVPVQFELRCRHQAEVPCWKFLCGDNDSISSECDKECNRKLPCGHDCGLKCNETCNKRCEVMVRKVWPCGHNLTRPCYQTQNPEDDPCRMKCRKTLTCEHSCPKTCGEPCIEKCLVNIEKKYPCGHFVKATCSSTPLESPCKALCRQSLPCGHACGGRCSLCSSRNIHKPCGFRVQHKRFCGHQLNIYCTGLDDPICDKAIKVSCSHGSHDYDCFSKPNYLTCNKPCEWNCVHFVCSRTCSDICNRPRCDERCQQKLKCGHQCYGLCGEPCLSICPKCQLRSFNNELKSSSSFDPNANYYQLICGHIFTVKYLDEFTQYVYHTSKSPVLVSPLLCSVETCSMPLSTSFRYGNAVKTSFNRLQCVTNCIRVADQGHGITAEILVTLLESKIHDINFFSKAWLDKELNLLGMIPCLKLQMQKLLNGASREKMFLIFLLYKIWMLGKSVQTDANTSGIQEELNNQERFIWTLLSQYKSCLTYSVVNDLEKEFLRVCLAVQCLAVKHNTGSALDQYPALSEAEAFLKEAALKKVKVTRKDFLSLLTSLSKYSSFASTSADMGCGNISAVLDLYYPMLLKGSWWGCPEGHYYCTPASMLQASISHQCPECKGSRIEFTNQEMPIAQPSLVSSILPETAAESLQGETSKSRKRPLPSQGASGACEEGSQNAMKRRRIQTKIKKRGDKCLDKCLDANGNAARSRPRRGQSNHDGNQKRMPRGGHAHLHEDSGCNVHAKEDSVFDRLGARECNVFGRLGARPCSSRHEGRHEKRVLEDSSTEGRHEKRGLEDSSTEGRHENWHRQGSSQEYKFARLQTEVNGSESGPSRLAIYDEEVKAVLICFESKGGKCGSKNRGERGAKGGRRHGFRGGWNT